MASVTFTHYGWFGLCPILISGHDTDLPTFQPRYDYTDWLFDFSDWMFDRCNDILSWLNEDYEPGFPYRISGKLETPITIQEED